MGVVGRRSEGSEGEPADFDFDAALQDAPKKDSGFSPLTLAWVLKGYDVRPAASALGLSSEQMVELDSFREWLLDRLTRSTGPE